MGDIGLPFRCNKIFEYIPALHEEFLVQACSCMHVRLHLVDVPMEARHGSSQRTFGAKAKAREATKSKTRAPNTVIQCVHLSKTYLRTVFSIHSITCSCRFLFS
jgi:hypothetical protein